MLVKALGMIRKIKKNSADEALVDGERMDAPVGDISKMLNASGRIGLQTLQQLAQLYKRPDFVRFMQQPVLVGASIQVGSLTAQPRSGEEAMHRTVLFEVDPSEETSSPSQTLKHAIYPLIKSRDAGGARNTFSIGRVDGNDMIMPDFAISKHHAVIDIRRGDYLLRDGGSTNGTLLNGQRVEKKPVKLHDGDLIGFARYEFRFVFPESLYSMLKGSAIS
jgi:hypothetical protein